MKLTKNLRLAVYVSGLLLSINSFAGISIEPLVGYNWPDKFKVDGGKSYYGGGGYAYGGKLGFEKNKEHGFSGGLDYLKSSVNMSDSAFKEDVTTDEWGVYLSFKLPALFKFYGEYIFAASGGTKIDSKNTNLSSGDGWKLGVGTTIIPFIDINLDYRTIKFNDFDYNAYLLSASWPIHLFE